MEYQALFSRKNEKQKKKKKEIKVPAAVVIITFKVNIYVSRQLMRHD